MIEQTLQGNVEMLNGVDIYFEIRGTGEPLVLLHGFFRLKPGLEHIRRGIRSRIPIDRA